MKLRIIFNNTDLATVLPDTALYIGNVTGREFVSPDVTTVAYKGAHGSRFVGNRYPARDIQVEVTVIGYCFQMMPSYASKLMSVLATDVPASLSFSDQEGTYQAIVSAIDLEEHETYARGTITFTCPDPYRYGEAQQVDLAETIRIDTNCTILPVLTFTATGKPSITVNGETLSIDKTLTGGVIDSQHNQVMDNGNNLLVAEVSGVFPLLRDVNHIETENISGGQFRYLMRWL